ncbi:MAG: cytochrome C [Opitutaceae bacterium]
MNSNRPWSALSLPVAALLGLAGLLSPTLCQAVPSFARQTGLSCIACHTSFPELTALGREFKLSGYTMSSEQSRIPPIAVMLQPSFTNTQAAQTGGAAPGFGANNNYALTQASLFYAGRLFGPYAAELFGPDGATVANRFGIFLQTTYDGVGKTWSWDNFELRYADTAEISVLHTSFGFYANNNPMLQDPWNSTTAWGYPFTSSGLAPSPAAATLIDGGLSQQVMSAGVYAMFDHTLYIDIAGYHTLGAQLQKSLGVDPTGEAQINRLAPYWRVALDKPVGPGSLEFGTFGLAANTLPGRDGSAGHDRTIDLGLDAQYQVAFARHDVSAALTWIDEHQHWTASEPLGSVSNPTDTLRTFKATVHYLYDKTYGLTVQYFTITGDSDALLYADSVTGSPNSDGAIFQLDYLPFNKGGGPAFWPQSNVKLSLQYTAYGKFDGARTNYDGSGRNARDNNTLYLEAWIVF